MVFIKIQGNIAVVVVCVLLVGEGVAYEIQIVRNPLQRSVAVK